MQGLFYWQIYYIKIFFFCKVCFFTFFVKFNFISVSTKTFLFCYIRMYRTFIDSKLFCSLSHCCIIFNNIICNLNRSLFDIIFQKNKPLVHIFYNVCGRFFAYSNLTIFNIKQKKPRLFSQDHTIFFHFIIKRWFPSFDFHSLLNEFVSSAISFRLPSVSIPATASFRLAFVFYFRFRLSLGFPFHNFRCFLSSF